MALIRVGVIRGGIGHEYEVSLQTGASVLKHLPESKYQVKDILITKDGVWHLEGLPISPSKAASSVDVFFNALHGEFGEDGQLQRLLDGLMVPYTGSGHLGSHLGMNKHLAKDLLVKNGIKTPYGITIENKEHTYSAEEIAHDAFKRIPPPWIVKPANGGSSVGVAVAYSFNDLVEAVRSCLKYSNMVMVEEYIKGGEATCGVVDKLRGEDIYPLFPIEIVKPNNKNFWDYQDKYSGETQEICPGRFSDEVKEKIKELAVKTHQVLNLKHYSRSDFIISPRGIYVLEVNTLPGLTENSLLPKAVKAVGLEYPHFLDHLIKLALNRE